MELHWPEPFKKFCREVASLISSLNVFQSILASIAPDLPNPECAFHLRYVQKWLLVLLSPPLIGVLCVFAVLFNVVVWKGLRVGTAYFRLRKTIARLLRQACQYLSRFLPKCRLRTSSTSSQDIDLSQPLFDTRSGSEEPGQQSVGRGSSAASLSGQEMGTMHSVSAMGTAPDVQPDEADASEEASANHGWQYRDWMKGRGGVWKTFDADTDRQLRAAMQSWRQGEGPEITHIEQRDGTYEINLQTREQINMDTGRRKKIRPAVQAEWTLVREWRANDWDASLMSTKRVLLLYLTLMYTYLVRTALEPLACRTDLDLSQWMVAAPGVKCDWCDEDPNNRYPIFVGTPSAAQDGSGSDSSDEGQRDFLLSLNYRDMATLSVVFYVVYAFATPVAFGLLLLDAARSESLQTNRFTKTFGFLTTKMKSKWRAQWLLLLRVCGVSHQS